MRTKKRFYTFSTRLKYKERNDFLKFCKKDDLTPSEMIRSLIIGAISHKNFLYQTFQIQEKHGKIKE